MKTIKKWIVLMLTLLLLIGLPMSVRSADTVDNTYLEMLNVVPYRAGFDDNRLVFVFSEAVNVDLTKASCELAIRKGAGDEHYFYTWDAATNLCTEVSTAQTDTCKTQAVWTISNFRSGTMTNGAMKLTNNTLGSNAGMNKLLAIYRSVLAQDNDVRLVANFRDHSDQIKDGYIDAVTSVDGSKKLKATQTMGEDDWTEVELQLLNAVENVNLYGDNLFLSFRMGVNSATLGNASYMLGLYKNGVALNGGPTWPLSKTDVRFFDADHKTLYVGFDYYDAVKAALAANPDYELGLIISSNEVGIDGLVKDASPSSYSYQIDISQTAVCGLIANTTADGKDAIYMPVTIQDSTVLDIVDAKFYGENQVLLTFNKPIEQTTNHYIGLSLHASVTDNSMLAYKWNDEKATYEYEKAGTLGSGNVGGDGITGWRRAQWDVKPQMTPFGSTGNQMLATLGGNVTIAQVLNACRTGLNNGRDLRIRIQENANQGEASNNWMVDTIWEVGNPTNKLSGKQEDGQTQTWYPIHGWTGGAARIGSTPYDDINAALTAACAGDTVSLLQDVQTNMLIVPADITLDINGYCLSTNTIVGFGDLIDSTEGFGVLKIDRGDSASFVHLRKDNTALPLYDTSVGGYRFFSYSVANVGTKTENNGWVKYGIKIHFQSLDAYRLLANDANADTMLLVDIRVGYNKITYVFNHSIFTQYYETIRSNAFSARNKFAITLTVLGLDPDMTISAEPTFGSPHLVCRSGGGFTYEGQYDSYTRAKNWIEEQIKNDTLFSFDYDGQPYTNHIKSWEKSIDSSDNRWTVTYKKGDVIAWSEITLDPETASVEWINYFKNNGTTNSPIISNIRAVNSTVSVENPILTGANGSTAEATDFQPFSIDLTQTTTRHMQSNGGRSSQGAFPYFDICNGKYGIMGAIGWTGDWSANFKNNNGNITIDAGMLKTNISLYKGEQMRTPMIMLQFFKGDQDDGHNAFRQLMLKSYTPSDASGKPIQYAKYFVGETNVTRSGEAALLEMAQKLDKFGSPYEGLWIDAGWYGDKSGDTASNESWSTQVGNWYFNPAYTNGNIKNLQQYLADRDVELLLWFEPERVYYNTKLYKEHKDWLLSKSLSLTYLYNFSDDAACDYMIQTISSIIKENGLTWYRQDCNIELDTYWEYAERNASNRKGMTEIKYVTNMYRYLDALMEQNPGLMIDNCASGGRRLDLEMMRRSIPLWNTDYTCSENKEDSTPDGVRVINYNLSWWLPISGGGWPNYNSESTTYAFRSVMASGLQLNSNFATQSEVKPLLGQYFKCREWMNGDYYILATGKDTAIETADSCYEFYKEDAGFGYLMTFRPENCTTQSAVYHLKGLNPKATYQLQWVDTGEVLTASGEQLMTEGVTVNYPQANLSYLIYIVEQ